MKITNPTVFLDSNRELKCLTVEVPKDPGEHPESIHYPGLNKTIHFGGDVLGYEKKKKKFETAIAQAKSSAVKVKNPIDDVMSFIQTPITDERFIFTLTGYEAEVSEEKCQAAVCELNEKCCWKSMMDHNGNDLTECLTKEFATISPIKNENQEELKEKIEFIKGAFQCYVGFEDTDGLLKFLEESNFKIVRK